METDNRRRPLTLEGNIDETDFRRFALYNTFKRRKAWRNPLLFTLIMASFSLVCFDGRKTHAQAVLLGSVLLGIGLVLPLVWVGMYLASVRRTARTMGLSREKAQYFVTLAPDKVRVTKGKEEAEYAWGDIVHVHRGRECIYLYVSAARAFLLPEGEKSGAAWELISSALPKEKLSS